MQGLVEKKCPLCKKVFYPVSVDWVYKIQISHNGYNYYCSWTCYRKAQMKKKKRK